ncbi:MAG TPA: hypothetical protein V6C72_08390, partial [Chroococcales cyanobacterium]
KKGDEAEDARDYPAAIDYYKLAAEQAKILGDGSDKRINALLFLLRTQTAAGISTEELRKTKHELLDASVRHMEAIYMDSGNDFSAVKDLDSGIIGKLDAEKLDTASAEEYSKKMVADARKAFKEGLYYKAISWLEEALDMEERAHGSGNVAETAEEFARSESPQAKAHINEIEGLIKRAKEAEAHAEHRQ